MTSSNVKSEHSLMNRRSIGFVLAVISVTISYFLPGTPDLSHEGITALGILLAAVFMWFCDTMPTGVVGLVGCFALLNSNF